MLCIFVSRRPVSEDVCAVAVSFTSACLLYLSGLGMHYTAKLQHLPEEQLFFLCFFYIMYVAQNDL